MKRVVLSFPTYGPVIPPVVDSMVNAVMFAATVGVVQWVGTASTDRQGWSEARNRPVQEVRKETDIDGIIWMDSDMLVPRDSFARLVDSGKDLVSGVYFQREPPYLPNVYGEPSGKGLSRLMEWPKGDVIAPVGGGFGFGICYTSLNMLRSLPERPFGFGEFSEDLGFCQMAAKHGFQPFVDFGIRCDHLEGYKWSNQRKFEHWRSVVSRTEK